MKLSPLLLLIAAMPIFAQMPKLEPGVSHDLAIWRAAHYSDVRYKLNLTLEKMSPVLKGTIEIRVVVSEPPASAGGQSANQGAIPIILDWRKLPGHENDSTLSNLTVNGIGAVPLHEGIAPLDEPQFQEASDHLTIYGGVKAGENVIKLDFTSPILTSGSAITRYIDNEDGSEYIYSLFVPSDASTAFPVFDQPDLKARFTLSIVKPRSWNVVSNAEWQDDPYWDVVDMPGQKEPPPQRVIFPETKPISTYVFAFAAGPWVTVSEPGAVATGGVNAKTSSKSPLATAPGSDPSQLLSIHYFVRRSQAAKFQPHAAAVFKMTRDGVNYLENYFDFKFPFPKYDIVLIPEFPFGGMEHAGETFVRESAIIFPSEPTKNDHISRATLIFHETAHQWFGDTVTMRWFDDLWLKEGFANFMAYKALEKIMPEMNAWKAFYERIKQPAYVTDSTKGTTAIYQPINNLSAAKSAYGNIVYNKAPAFLRQAEFYLGEDKFQTAVRAFLKKHAFANATWQDLVKEFQSVTNQDLTEWSARWVLKPGVPKITIDRLTRLDGAEGGYILPQEGFESELGLWPQRIKTLRVTDVDKREILVDEPGHIPNDQSRIRGPRPKPVLYYFLNYEDYGYGIFLLDDKSREYVLQNIQNEKDPFLRSMMWGALWDSVREAELDPREYVRLVYRILGSPAYRRPPQDDESTVASLLGRLGTAMNYYVPQTDLAPEPSYEKNDDGRLTVFGSNALQGSVETMLMAGMSSKKQSERIVYFRALLNIARSKGARDYLKQILAGETKGRIDEIPIRTKDKFDIVTRLAILGDPDAARLLGELEKTETSDDAKRYAYAARAAFPTKENREKFWNDFVNNKTISESWIEAAIGPFNSPLHDDLSVPYLTRALGELPNLKRTRKIFFVNNWLGAFIGGQRSQAALDIVNKFLADNPNLDRDLRLKILENMDVIERSVRIRKKYSNI